MSLHFFCIYSICPLGDYSHMVAAIFTENSWNNEAEPGLFACLSQLTRMQQSAVPELLVLLQVFSTSTLWDVASARGYLNH